MFKLEASGIKTKNDLIQLVEETKNKGPIFEGTQNYVYQMNGFDS